MPAEAPKRRLPKFSLITLIVAVNVAGVLLWANVNGRPFDWRLWDFSGNMYIHTYHVFLDILISLIVIVAAGTLTEFLVRKLRKLRKAKRHDG